MFRAILAAALSMMLFANAAHATMVIIDDVGGEMGAHDAKFGVAAISGEPVMVKGRCLSACTLVTGIIPPSHICVTDDAVFGYHLPSVYDYRWHVWVPTDEFTDELMSVYKPVIRDYIMKHGGLTPRPLFLKDTDLKKIYRPCK